MFDAYDNEYTVAITQSNQEFPNYPLNLIGLHIPRTQMMISSTRDILCSPTKFRVSIIKLMIDGEEGSL